MDNLIEKARAVALEALKEETRYDGLPFMEHPDNVARIVEDEIGLPEPCVAAVYLHEAVQQAGKASGLASAHHYGLLVEVLGIAYAVEAGHR